jgi:nitrite reductase (NADH) small subunit
MTAMKQQVLVAKHSDLSPRIGREVIVDGNRIAVFRLLDDTVKAIGGVCPHSLGPLAEGMVI